MKVTVQYEWEFTKKEWTALIKHIEEIKQNPRIVWKERIDYDPLDTFYHMNQLSVPIAKLIKVENG